MTWFKNPSKPVGNTTAVCSSAAHASDYQQYVELPPKAGLSTHASNSCKPGSPTVGMVKKTLDQIERPVITVSDQVSTQTQGRSKQFFRSAANVARKMVGIRRRPVPPVLPSQGVRPVIPAVESKTGNSLFAPIAETTLRRQVAARGETKAGGFLATRKLSRYGATTQPNALAGKVNHIGGVHQGLIASLGQARTDQVKATESFKKVVDDLCNATNQLQETGEQLTKLEAKKTNLDAGTSFITINMLANTARRRKLEARLASLPNVPRPEDVRKANSAYRRNCAALTRTETRLHRQEQSLVKAQKNLDRVKQKMRGTRLFSQERATCRAEVIYCRAVRNDAQAIVRSQLRTLNERQKLKQDSGERANALGSREGVGARESIQSLLQDVQNERDALRAAAIYVALKHSECVAQLAVARDAHEKAQEAELKSRIAMESAGRVVTSKRELADGLSREMGRIAPVGRGHVAIQGPPVNPSRTTASFPGPRNGTVRVSSGSALRLGARTVIAPFFNSVKMPPLNTATTKLPAAESVELPHKTMPASQVSKTQKKYFSLVDHVFPSPKDDKQALSLARKFPPEVIKQFKGLVSELPLIEVKKFALVQVLARVTQGDANQATELLAYLSEPLTLDRMGGSSPVEQQAVQVARTLSHSADGMAALLSLQSETARQGMTGSAAAAVRREALAVWLQAGSELIASAPGKEDLSNTRLLMAYAAKHAQNWPRLRKTHAAALALQAASEVFQNPDFEFGDAKQEKAYRAWVKDTTLAWSPATKHIIGNEQKFIEKTAQLFSTSGSDAASVNELAKKLMMTMPETHRASSAVPYSEGLQLMRALAHTTGGSSKQALAALDQMKGIISLKSLGGRSPVQQQALQTACILSCSSTGIRTLLSLYADPSLIGDEVHAKMKREAFVMLLQTTHRILPPEKSDAKNHANLAELVGMAKQQVEKLGAQAQESMVWQALLGAAAVFDKPLEIPKDDAQVGAYFAWRQGLGSQEDGLLASQVKFRMRKCLDWIARAERRAENNFVALDPRRALGLQKSPLTAMGYGTAGANLGMLDEETEKLQVSVVACIDRMADRCRAASAHQEEVSMLLKLLDSWKEHLRDEPFRSKLHLPTKLQKSPARLAKDVEVARPITESFIRSPESKEFRVLSLASLSEWHRKLNALGVPDIDTAPDLDVLLATARDLEASSPIKPDGKDQQSYRDALVKTVASPPGNNVRYFDGGWHGPNLHLAVNLAGISPQGVALGVAAAPVVKAVRGRHAFVEVGSSSYGGEFFFGSDKRWSTAIGASGFAGIKFNFGHFQSKVGAGLGATYGFEKSEPSGVIIRSKMLRNADGSTPASWRGPLIDVINYFFDQAENLEEATAKLSAEQFWIAFAKTFFQQQDISVNWRNNDRLSHGVDISGYAGLRIAIGKGVEAAYLGPAATMDYNVIPYARNHRIDASGWLQGTELAEGRSTYGMFNLSTLIAAPAIGNPDSHVRGNPSSATMPGLNVGGVAFPLLTQGAFAVLRLVEDNEQLNPTFSRLLIEFADPVNFLSYAEALRPVITADERSSELLSTFLKKVKAAARNGNQYFGESRKFYPEVTARISAYKDDIACLKALQDPLTKQAEEEIAQLNAEIHRLLTDEESSFRAAFYVYEMNSEGYSDRGIPGGLQLTAATSSLGERQLLQLTMDELKQAAQREQSEPVPTEEIAIETNVGAFYGEDLFFDAENAAQALGADDTDSEVWFDAEA